MVRLGNAPSPPACEGAPEDRMPGSNVDLAPRVIEMIARELHVDPKVLNLESTFEELDIDSLDGVNILFRLEEEFHIDIPDRLVREATSIGQVVDNLSLALEGKAIVKTEEIS